MEMQKERIPEPKAFESVRVIINPQNIYAEKKKNPPKKNNQKAFSFHVKSA